MLPQTISLPVIFLGFSVAKGDDTFIIRAAVGGKFQIQEDEERNEEVMLDSLLSRLLRHPAGGNEGVFNLQNVTNVVSDILFILIMKDGAQPTKLSAYTLHLL